MTLKLNTIQKIIGKAREPELALEHLEDLAVDLAEQILVEAKSIRTRKEKTEYAQIARMIEDTAGKAFSLKLADQCFRSKDNKRIANQISYLISCHGVPSFLSPVRRFEIRGFKLIASVAGGLLIPMMQRMLREESSSVILPAEDALLKQHVARRAKENIRLNINYLGEAILGEEEARGRLELYAKALKNPDIEYISIKISTLYSQISHIAFDDTVEVLAGRLRDLYRLAIKNKYKGRDGIESSKFVNLDMEEFKDLQMTVVLFKKVLEEEEFLKMPAGIVLQAYLPDSFKIQKELTEWAMKRVARGGSPIKIRLVKGANLAMEKVEASLKGWPVAPYNLKSDVDANYKRMLIYACQKEHALVANIGLASHNIFDIALGMLLMAREGIEKSLCFEMLEGMASHVSRVVHSIVNELLLYCPIVNKEDFQYAIGYLVRRLDENTAPDNFLRHLFNMEPATPIWKDQERRFREAFRNRGGAGKESHRKQNRFHNSNHLAFDHPFANESDTDWSLSANQMWIRTVIQEWKDQRPTSIPLVIGTRTFTYESEGGKGEGKDPSHPKVVLYTYTMANEKHVEEALSRARASQESWRDTPLDKKCTIFVKIAEKLRDKRGYLIAAMIADGGKTALEADAEVSEAIDFAEYYWRSFKAWKALDGISCSPLGTVLVVPPWNFPCAIPAGGILASLITGNTVIFKPSRETVLVAWELVQAFWDAGVPKDVLQFLTGSSSIIGDCLIQDERINVVVLTGSTDTGKHMLRVRPRLHLLGETGGKNAIIIAKMADRDLALRDLVCSAFGHAGQKCSAASLGILDKEIYNDPHFKAQLKDVVTSFKIGSAWDFRTKINPLIYPPEGVLKKGLTTLDEGEEWLVEPKQVGDNPNLWSPGVKWGVKEGSFSHQNEFFGPLLSIMCAENLEHAIHLANSTAYGLTGGIHSLDEREHQIWLDQIEIGNCYINRGVTGAIVQRQPFGGCKASSFGPGFKVGGPNYLITLMNVKEIKPSGVSREIAFELITWQEFLQSLETPLDDISLWEASVESYQSAWELLQERHDPSQVLGQHNYLRYVPRENIVLRLEEGDNWLDLARVCSLCILCGVPLEVSYDSSLILNGKQKSISKIDWPKEEIDVVEERYTQFLERVKSGDFERVRTLRKAPEAIFEVAAHHGTYVYDKPVLSHGEIEILYYVREQSVSIDYHRYGNVGKQE